MGCDIHMVVERKVNGKWLGLGTFKSCGLPDDISDLTRYEVDQWGSDGHSHSWLPLADAARIFLETNSYDGKINPESWEAQYPGEYFFEVDGNYDDHRLVFWFDN